MLIVGTGAVATLLAERLHRLGIKFQIFGGPSERLRALESRFPGTTVSRAVDVRRHNGWTICLKTWQNKEKAMQLRGAPSPEAILVLQNGLAPELDWSGLAPRVDRVLSTYGVKTVAPGRIEGGAAGQMTLHQGSPFAPLLERMGFSVLEVENLRAAVWKKLAVNASLNIVATLFGVTNGQVLEIPEACRRAHLVANEVGEVAARLGVEWGALSAWEITRTVAEQTAENVCSTLADFRTGRPTEYQAINGEILAAAGRLGLAVPHLEKLDRDFQAGSGVRAACA